MYFEDQYNLKQSALMYPDQSKDSFNKFIQAGVPTRKTEDWKYTNLNTWIDPKTVYSLDDKTPRVAEFSFDKNFINDNILTTTTSDNDKIELYNHKNAPDKLKKTIFSLFDEVYSNDSIYKFLLSMIDEVQILHIKSNCVVDSPIFIQRNTDYFYTLVLADKSSQATIVEVNARNSKNKAFTQGITRVLQESNSQVEHICLQAQDNNSLSNTYTSAHVKRDACYNHFYFNTGSLMSRNNLLIELNEQGANTNSYGLFTLNGNQHNDNRSQIRFNNSHTFGNQLYKGILDDKSHGIFNGIIVVEKDSQLIESSQLNKNLVLGKTAHINSQPQLEVFADDVKCSHGSTTGQLDEDQLFYFQSRCIKPEVARVKLAYAFCFDITTKVKNKNIKEWLEKHINEKLENLASIRN